MPRDSAIVAIAGNSTCVPRSKFINAHWAAGRAGASRARHWNRASMRSPGRAGPMNEHHPSNLQEKRARIEKAAETAASLCSFAVVSCHMAPLWALPHKKAHCPVLSEEQTVAPFFCEDASQRAFCSDTSGQCEGCGRLVHNTEGFWTRRVTAASDCELLRQHAHLPDNTALRPRGCTRGVWRMRRAISSQAVPTRHFCSVRLAKQKAYRKRVTLNNGPSWPRALP